MPGYDQPVFVYTAWPSCETAAEAGQALVEARLAAAVNIIGSVKAIYRWRGRVEQAQEWLMIIKTRQGRVDEVLAEVKRRHPYEEPGIAVLPLSGGSASYLEWMVRESGG